MNRTILRRCLHAQPRCSPRRWQSSVASLPIVQIEKATFYRQYPSANPDQDSTNPPIFPDLTFSLPNNLAKAPTKREHWAIVSPTSLARTTFLRVLNNDFLTVPPTARSFPYLSSENIQDTQLRRPEKAIKYVGFDAERGGIGGTSLKGAYLSARYEARKEETDWSLKNYLEGNTELNPLDQGVDHVDRRLLEQVVHNLRLEELLDRPVSNLSNGQTRRARIAKTLLSKPELLLLDGPFMGLDPRTVSMLSTLLQDMAHKNAPRIVLSLRPEDRIPDWTTHLMYIDSNLDILAQGKKTHVFRQICDSMERSGTWKYGQNAVILQKMRDNSSDTPDEPADDSVTPETSAEAQYVAAPGASNAALVTPIASAKHLITRDAFPTIDPANTPGEPIVEMQGVKVSYGPSDSATKITVLGEWQQPELSTPGLHWSIHRGQRWGIFGPNGSGKTTLLSLVTSDHPQAYSLPIKHFGRSRLPEQGQPGISIFELQKRMGHSSPEVHTFFPKHLTIRRVLESAWADAPLAKPQLSHDNDRKVDSLLRWFAADLSPSGTSVLKDLTLDWKNSRRSPKRDYPPLREEVRRKIERFDGNGDDLDWADTHTFRDLNFSQQRLALFLRAIVAQPDLVILDEAFSGIDEQIRDKALLFLSQGEKLEWVTEGKGRTEKKVLVPSVLAEVDAVVFEGLTEQQALLVISHSREDVPGCVRDWICLPEAGDGQPARWGSLEGPLELNPKGWEQIWDSE